MGNTRRGPGGAHSPDDHEKRHCKGFGRDAMDQGLQRAREGAHRLGDHFPRGVDVGEWPAGFRGRDAARTQTKELGEADGHSLECPQVFVHSDLSGTA